MDNLDTLGKRIAYLRKEKNLTQRDLMGILNFENLSKYEKDQREPKLELLISISEFFNVSLDFLIIGKERLNSNLILSDDNLNKEEYQLLQLFKNCSKKHKLDTINTIKDFLSNPEYDFKSPIIDLNKEELKIIELFRSLSTTDKIKVEGVIESKLIENKKVTSSTYQNGEEAVAIDKELA